MLKIPIKASRIANLTDARYFAAKAVTWMGFTLDSSADNFLRPEEFVAIREWIEGPENLVEFGLQTSEQINQLCADLQINAVQVGPFTTLEELSKIKAAKIFQEIIIDAETTATALAEKLREAQAFVQYFLLNFSRNGLGWEQLQNHPQLNRVDLQALAQEFPILLDIPCPADQLETLLEEIPVKGLSVEGGAEEKVGVKSYDELDDWLEILENEEW